MNCKSYNLIEPAQHENEKIRSEPLKNNIVSNNIIQI